MTTATAAGRVAPAFAAFEVKNGRARCPAHDDRTPSLSVKEGDDGSCLIHCHAGCHTDAVLAAVGLTTADLFVQDDRPPTPTGRGSLVATYDYRDAEGRPAYIVRKYEPKSFSMHKPDGSPIGTTPRVPYRLPEVVAASKVVIVEGEKDADRLAALGVVATTNAGGAGKWDPSWAPLFAGKVVTILPDNDDAGRDHAAAVAASLRDVAQAVRIVTLPGLDPKEDVSDWLDRGHTVQELRELTVATLAEMVPTIGTRTAADLASGPPPPLLAAPFLHPDGATVLYGKGGVGKGMISSWLIGRLVAEGHTILILDYEAHEREWGSRLRGLGMPADALGRVHYREPYGRDWTLPQGPLSAVSADVRDDCDRLGVTYVVVDSYHAATSNGEAMGGEAGAQEYFRGLVQIGRPSLTIAHVKGDAERFPPKPFGSTFVHNTARRTWAVESLDTDHEPDYGPHVINLEMRNQKHNDYAKEAAQFVSFSFFADGTISASADQPTGRSTADRIEDVLRDGPMTLREIVAAIKEDFGETTTQDTCRKAMQRHPRRFAESTGEQRPRKWSLR